MAMEGRQATQTLRTACGAVPDPAWTAADRDRLSAEDVLRIHGLRPVLRRQCFDRDKITEV